MRALGANKFSVELDVGGIERVPAILQHPKNGHTAPGGPLVHGFQSRKEDMGVASLAIDLPMHGQRISTARQLSIQNPLALVDAWRLALREAGLAITYLADQTDDDQTRLGVA